MKILMTGGTGFIGHHLSTWLSENGHQVTILSRHPQKKHDLESDSITIEPWPENLGKRLNEIDAVINLAGENLFGQRWTASVKRRILESRVKTTRSIIEGIRTADEAPGVLVSASAVGYYGSRGRERIHEKDAPANDFLAVVCQQWEDEAKKAEACDVRTVITRIGLPLQTDGGVLGKMLTPFKFGVGGPLGNGRQFFPWIHMTDLCRAVNFLMTKEDLSGPFNMTAPIPVTMRQFAVDLGRVLHRPAWLSVPKFALDLLLGEAAKSVTASLRVVPQKLLNAGFEFQFRELEPALRDLLR
ncbi:MAG TPA: TIGR01777 family oxidoreductase [Balneolales bacterium]|nr:TIGR01777 family oxidoreductase [Balneolales bacterium]